MPIRVGRNNQKPSVHKSLDLFRNKPMAVVEVSGVHYTKNPDGTPNEKNPQGWGDPHYLNLPEFGWDSALFDHARKMRDAGYRILGLWEPGSVYYPTTQENMGYFNFGIVQKCWTPTMIKTWRGFLAKLRSIDMEPMFYFNANSDFTRLVDDLAWCRSALGVHAFGLDAFSYIVKTNIKSARAVIQAIRDKPETEDVSLLTEGQLPVDLSDDDRRFFLTNMAQLELARGGPDKSAADDVNLTRILPAVDDALVKGAVRYVYCHGSQWKQGDREDVYQFMRASGCIPADSVAPLLEWK